VTTIGAACVPDPRSANFHLYGWPAIDIDQSRQPGRTRGRCRARHRACQCPRRSGVRACHGVSRCSSPIRGGRRRWQNHYRAGGWCAEVSLLACRVSTTGGLTGAASPWRRQGWCRVGEARWWACRRQPRGACVTGAVGLGRGKAGAVSVAAGGGDRRAPRRQNGPHPVCAELLR